MKSHFLIKDREGKERVISTGAVEGVERSGTGIRLYLRFGSRVVDTDTFDLEGYISNVLEDRELFESLCE